MPVFIPIPYYLAYYSFVVSFEIRKYDAEPGLFDYKNCSSYYVIFLHLEEIFNNGNSDIFPFIIKYRTLSDSESW